MNLEERLAALLAVVEAHQRAACNEIEARAAQEARTLIAQAWRNARTQLHAGHEAQRSRLAAAVEQAEAALAAEARLAQQRGVRAALAAAWPRLEAALRARWKQPGPRRRWIEYHLGGAAQQLAGGPWRIEHGRDWSDDDRATASEWIAAHSPRESSFARADDISAGFRLRAGYNILDATLDGLLADRSFLEARLVAAVERVP